jgi:DedD protein
MSTMAEPADINVDELRRRARRRLVGAVVLALGVAVVVPMLLETEQKPLGEDVAVKIPPVDDGKFVNRLNDPTTPAAKAQEAAPAASSPPQAPAVADAPERTSSVTDAPARTSKYDTRIPDAAPSATPPSADGARSGNASAPATQAPGETTDMQSSSAPPAPKPAAADNAAVAATKPSNAQENASKAADKPVIITDKSASANERPAGSAHREGFAVQLAAFADDKGANSLAGRLKRAGYTAYTEPLKTSKGTLWRVRVGPYPSREAALAARDKLKTEGQNGIVAATR